VKRPAETTLHAVGAFWPNFDVHEHGEGCGVQKSTDPPA
jgi:hypothetical protein